MIYFFSMIYKVLFKLMQIVTWTEFPCGVALGRNFIVGHGVPDNSVAVGFPAVSKPRRMDEGGVDPTPLKSERQIS
jgi:hypothetical protein